ncbi:MAG TPA: protein kinase [Terriglobia bacterium]|nr:protein kinase [Terriglobia bacterium]
MVLTSGKKLGPYEILSPVGAGGMGEVYRARDPRLGREVALKVLPAALAQDPDRMARFQREAQVLASLNHPNIAALYGLEESAGVLALVMELVEGPTLAERLSGTQPLSRPASGGPPSPRGRGAAADGSRSSPMPVDEALPIAGQITEALEAAHERGIVHRDLKPANIKVTRDGTVKVLDFGLAKALDAEVSASNISNSPTMTAAATQAGVILGTAAYMSPEQARGKRVDKRADIWAFGVVLYEMLTGRHAFASETTSDTLAAVLTTEPNWDALPAGIPANIRRLLRRCLEKDPRLRLRDIGEARIAIEETLRGAADVPAGLPGQEKFGGVKPPLQRALPWVVALAFAILGAALGWRISSQPNTSAGDPVVSFIPAPPGTTFRSVGFNAGPVVISPDGKQLAFSATDQDGVTKIWVRPLNSSSATPVAGTEDGASIFWSGDSHSLGFYADGKLKTVDLAGGNVQVLADASPDGGSDWGLGGFIFFKPPHGNEIYKIQASGGTPVAASRLGKDETNQASATFLPDGKHFVYGVTTTSGQNRIAMASLDSSQSKLVLDGAWPHGYAAGFLFFSKTDGEVLAQPFDPATGTLSGKAEPLAKADTVSATSASILAYQGASSTARLEWFDRSGNPLGALGEIAEYNSPKISPDGKQVLARVVNHQTGTDELWSFPVSGGVSTRLTFSSGAKIWSVWSPDGKYLAYAGASGGQRAIFRKPADGSGEAELLYTPAHNDDLAVIDWSPDGRYLSYGFANTTEGHEENWILPLVGEKKPFQVVHTDAGVYDGNFSPDGRWFAYFSFESGRGEVYVIPFPGPGGKYQISHTGGWLVRWASGGKLFYSTLGNRLMEADLALGATSLQVKSIHPLFEMNPPNIPMPFFDMTPDGEKFVVVTSDRPESSSITLVTNWTALLKKQ